MQAWPWSSFLVHSFVLLMVKYMKSTHGSGDVSDVSLNLGIAFCSFSFYSGLGRIILARYYILDT